MEASQPKPRRLTGYQLAAACIDLAASLEQPNFKAAFRGRGFAIVFTSEMSVAFLWYRAFEHAVEEVGVAAQRFATARNDEWWWTSQDEDACVGGFKAVPRQDQLSIAELLLSDTAFWTKLRLPTGSSSSVFVYELAFLLHRALKELVQSGRPSGTKPNETFWLILHVFHHARVNWSDKQLHALPRFPFSKQHLRLAFVADRSSSSIRGARASVKACLAAVHRALGNPKRDVHALAQLRMKEIILDDLSRLVQGLVEFSRDEAKRLFAAHEPIPSFPPRSEFNIRARDAKEELAHEKFA
ncbi:hypothetical protein JCM3766R1_002252 [Sporobolomyces carnicolor]